MATATFITGDPTQDARIVINRPTTPTRQQDGATIADEFRFYASACTGNHLTSPYYNTLPVETDAVGDIIWFSSQPDNVSIVSFTNTSITYEIHGKMAQYNAVITGVSNNPSDNPIEGGLEIKFVKVT